ANGNLARIVEARDASSEERALGEVNSGIYVFRAEKLWPALERLEPQSAQGELYVTDTLGLLVADGETCAVQLADDPFEAEGVNTRVELALAAASLRDRINEAHMLAGVTIVDPATTWIEAGVEIEPDVVVHPFTGVRGGVPVGGGGGSGALPRPPPRRGVGARARRSARSSRSRTSRSGPAQRSRTSPMSATPRWARGRMSRPATSRRTSSMSRASPRPGRRSAATSGPAWTLSSMPRSRLAT